MQATLLRPVPAPKHKPSRVAEPVAPPPKVGFRNTDLWKAAGVISAATAATVALIIYLLKPFMEQTGAAAGKAAAEQAVQEAVPTLELRLSREAAKIADARIQQSDARLQEAVLNLRRELEVRHEALLTAIRQLKEK